MTMARIRQVREVIFKRKGEELDRQLAYREMEVRAMMSATYVSSTHPPEWKNAQIKAAHTWKLPRPGAKPEDTRKPISTSQAGRVFGTTKPAFTDSDIAARRAELEAGK